MIARTLFAALLFATVGSVDALEYRSTNRAALLYDAPSTASLKTAIAGPGMPLEIVVDTDAWAKVRDPSGRLAWIEKTALGNAKTVMIKADAGTARAQPRADADVVFRAARGVLLNLTGPADAYGWLPVKHPEGLAGWVPAHEVWGQ